MEGIGQIFSGIIDSDSDSLLTVFLSNLAEHQSFWTDPQNDLDSIFTKIGNLLNNAKTRERGFKILIHLLPECPLDVVEEKAQFYVYVCIKSCEQRGKNQSLSLVFELLQQLINRSLSSNELHKLFVSNLPKLVGPVGPKLAVSAIPSVLRFLEQTMLHYAGACGQVKSRIESFLYSLVDSTDPVIVDGTARCLLQLQQISGGGQHGTLHKKTWQEYYLKLVDTIHDLLNKIFVHTPETFDEEENLECLKLPPLEKTTNAVRKALLLSTRAGNLIAFLHEAIVGPYPVAKPITPFKALNLVLRGLSVSCEAMGKNAIAENIAFGTFLPSLHLGLLGMLDGLVLAFGSNLLMYGDVVYEVFPKCLRATQTTASDTDGTKKSFTRLRMKIYESIQLWCDKMRYGSSIETVNEALLEQIVPDITPYESEMMLKMGATNKKRLSSRAKRKLQKEQNAATALNQAHSSSGAAVAENKEQLIDRGNDTLCQAALECLTVVLQSAGCFIKPVTQKLLQEKIVPLCFSLVMHPQLTGLYSNDKVRVALLRAFAALIVNPHHHCPPPLQYAGYIFNTLQTTDSSAAVRSTAAELARTTELVLHPWKETLYFPADKSAIKDALANKDKHPLAMLVARPTFTRKEANGMHNGMEDMTDAVFLAPEVSVSPKKATIATVEEAAYESEGEINESLAVTEASDESIADEDEQQPDEQQSEAVGWVENIDDSVDAVETNETVAVLDGTGSGYDEGVFESTDGEHDKLVEPSVVSLLDSDEEQVVECVEHQRSATDDDDVMEVPLTTDSGANKPLNGKGSLKHAIASQTSNGGSPKKAKLSPEANTNCKAKNIDDIVEEMVAEFVDEP
uniref:Pre-rRNA-processing protein RIX1 N-terminal domain-containing protein n=1 Tax=Anopheles dirus TaxID=7168 RepID=A0A182NL44_9DIPT